MLETFKNLRYVWLYHAESENKHTKNNIVLFRGATQLIEGQPGTGLARHRRARRFLVLLNFHKIKILDRKNPWTRLWVLRTWNLKFNASSLTCLSSPPFPALVLCPPFPNLLPRHHLSLIPTWGLQLTASHCRFVLKIINFILPLIFPCHTTLKNIPEVSS